MDEGMLLALASRRARRMVSTVTGLLFLLLVVVNRDAVVAVTQASADRAASRYQAAVDRLLSDLSDEPQERVPVAPGKLKQLQRDLRRR